MPPIAIATTTTTTTTSTTHSRADSSNSGLKASRSRGVLRRSPSGKPHPDTLEGQNKDSKSKKAGRYGDVIDTWDPTGLGSTMWHHSGPYDAAAPQRNVNQPGTKAPMHAFKERPEPTPPRTSPAVISHAPAPELPSKDVERPLEKLREPREQPREIRETREPRERREPRVEQPRESRERRDESSGRRPSSATRRRTSEGGLTGTYSTSVPSGGAYFPDQTLEEEDDEESTSRKERQRAREEKQRALKAAWGIDTPEPYEDFGSSPRDESYIDLGADYTSPEARSPGFRLGGGGPRSPPIVPEDSVISVDDVFATRGHNPRQNSGGVKRTKSLMQKIKSMVRRESDESVVPMPSPTGGIGSRSQSMSDADYGHGYYPGHTPRRPSQGDFWRDAPVAEEAEEDGGDIVDFSQPAGWGPPASASPSIPSPGVGPGYGDDLFGPRSNRNGTDRARSPSKFSPSSEYPPIPASSPGPESRSSASGSASDLMGSAQARSSPIKLPPRLDVDAAEELDETLPQLTGNPNRRPSTAVPVMPVIPDFDDIVTRRRGSQSASFDPEPVQIKRKASIVKKLTGRAG